MRRGEALLLAKEIAAAIKEGEKLVARYGEDRADGTVIAFTKQFVIRGAAIPVRLELPYEPEDIVGDDINPADVLNAMRQQLGTRTYNYAAIRSGGLWYTTGPKSPKGFEWEELIDWLDSGYPVAEIQVLREAYSPRLIATGPVVDTSLVAQYARSGLESHGIDPDAPEVQAVLNVVLATISGESAASGGAA